MTNAVTNTPNQPSFTVAPRSIRRRQKHAEVDNLWRVDSVVHDAAVHGWVHFALVRPSRLYHVGRLSGDRERRFRVRRVKHLARARERNEVAAAWNRIDDVRVVVLA